MKSKLIYTSVDGIAQFADTNIQLSREIQSQYPLETYFIAHNKDNRLSPAQCYEASRLTFKDYDILNYIHDDVEIHEENWLDRVEAEFTDPDVVVVGMGGALGLGTPDIYKKPYKIDQMARQQYRSNQTDWEVHGVKEDGNVTVAVVDAFFMAVRTQFLSDIGGWPVNHLTHHCLDLWICLEAASRGKKVRSVGVSVTHHGGGTSVKGSYHSAPWLQGGTMSADHATPHRWLYDSYRDVLPVRVRP